MIDAKPPAIIHPTPLREVRFGLSYAVSRVGYDRFTLPRDVCEANLRDLLAWVPDELRSMPWWALQGIIFCPPTPFFSAGVKTTTFLTATSTSTQTWSVPADMNTGATAEVVSHAGSASIAGTPAGGGGGGGGYAKASGVSLTPSGSATYRLAPAGNGSDDAHADWFNGASLAASSVGIRGGSNAVNETAGAGAVTTNAIGSVKYAGGTGSNGSTDGGNPRGGAGGGAAGPSGAGGNASGAPPSNIGGSADNGTVAGGAWQTVGNSGTEWDGSHGSGSGAGGANNDGVDGALYGGAGSGGGDTAVAAGASKQGIIVVINNP